MKCNYCEWRCDLKEGKYGICRMYHEIGGKIKERFPNRWSTYHLYQMESMPFYHVDPGSRCMSIGTAGCNLSCRYCANAFIAREDPEKNQDSLSSISGEQLISLAFKHGCTHIIFNVNEPAVSFPSLQELSREAKAAGIHMGCLTNAYTTEESTELLASIFSFINISLKGLSSEFCKEYLGIPDIKPVLRNIRRLSEISHIEITTPVIDSVNDSDLMEMASFLHDVDKNIPWHVFRLLPEHDMKNVTYPDINSVNTMLNECRSMLPYIYFHNFVGSDWVNTACPSCSSNVIERISLGCGGDKLMTDNSRNNSCPECGYHIPLYHCAPETVHCLKEAAL